MMRGDSKTGYHENQEGRGLRFLREPLALGRGSLAIRFICSERSAGVVPAQRFKAMSRASIKANFSKRTMIAQALCSAIRPKSLRE